MLSIVDIYNMFKRTKPPEEKVVEETQKALIAMGRCPICEHHIEPLIPHLVEQRGPYQRCIIPRKP